MLQSWMWGGAAVAAAVLMLVAGWWASARHHQRQIDFLLLQLKVTRQTAQAHTDQARRQIGQLQAELATRPPAAQAQTQAHPHPHAQIQEALADAQRRRMVTPDRFGRDDDGFPHTAVIGPGFAPTQLQG